MPMGANHHIAVMIRWRKESILDIYKLVFGLLLLLSPWMFAFSYQPARIDSWTTGLLVVVVALGSLAAYDDREELLMILVGVWVLGSPWVFHYPHGAATKIHIGIGLVIAYLAALELFLVHYAGRSKCTSPRKRRQNEVGLEVRKNRAGVMTGDANNRASGICR
jgi:SPW repeat